MAEKLNNYTFRKRGPKPKYPWDEWLNGEVWQLALGQDFDTSPCSMRFVAYKTAASRGLKLHTNTDGATVTFQAYKP